MKLEVRTMRLIAVGASLAANCQPCLQINVSAALQAGIDEQEIMEAIGVGRRVRRGAASKMDSLAADLCQGKPLPDSLPNDDCECSSLSVSPVQTKKVHGGKA